MRRVVLRRAPPPSAAPAAPRLSHPADTVAAMTPAVTAALAGTGAAVETAPSGTVIARFADGSTFYVTATASR